MPIQSMTGFARSDGANGATTWHWELRSVNNRSLDVRLRLPPNHDRIEAAAREGISKRMTRGSISVSLTLQTQAARSEIRVNERALADVRAAAEALAKELGSEPPRAESLLALKGVLEVAEEEENPDIAAARQSSLIDTLNAALDGLVRAREDEGQRLFGVITTQIDEIERITSDIEKSPGRTPGAIAKRLADQVSRLVETGQQLEPARLHQEAVLMATRADVEEEIQRLRGHIEAARQLLEKGGPIGRKLDFLSQEFNREANTLTSKAPDREISRCGLALKVVIDQMREQVQNIE